MKLSLNEGIYSTPYTQGRGIIKMIKDLFYLLLIEAMMEDTHGIHSVLIFVHCDFEYFPLMRI